MVEPICRGHGDERPGDADAVSLARGQGAGAGAPRPPRVLRMRDAPGPAFPARSIGDRHATGHRIDPSGEGQLRKVATAWTTRSAGRCTYGASVRTTGFALRGTHGRDLCRTSGGPVYPESIAGRRPKPVTRPPEN